jgi:hypothetical protein
MTKRTISIFVCTLLLTTIAANAGEPKRLFNGKDTKGWTQKGGEAVYTVENGVLVGSSRPNTPNSFLCPDQLFGDFELTFETKCDPELNSGVQIRSADSAEMLPADMDDQDRKKAINRTKSGSLCGPQVEIAAKGGAGGVYFEGVGGWLVPTNPEVAKSVYKPEGWNAYKVIAKGDHIQVWINDTKISDAKDTRSNFRKGYLGFQVHGVGKRTETLQVRWRNIVIREL